jgi:Ca-activated chloride channel family protein
MNIDLNALHFLRPGWLLLIPLAGLLLWRWQRLSNDRAHWHGVIAEHLLRHLLVMPKGKNGVPPIRLLTATLVLGAVAVAGPSWEKDRPAFLENRAPLILAVDLSPSMNDTDVPPSRLEAAKHKLHDLVNRRRGARIGLIAYAGSAHLVLPPTDDPVLLDSFLQVLSSTLITTPGKDLLGVVDIANRLLAAEHTPGTLVLVTDGADPTQFTALAGRLAQEDLQLLVLAVTGQADSHLKQLANATDAPLGSVTGNDDDLDWIELHAQRHFEATSAEQQRLQWKDSGYWLLYPLLVLALLSLRRGWSLNWSAAVLLALSGAQPAHASGLSDAFLTADQQGRWAYEHHHYQQAMESFQDPYWKGLAAYALGDYASAQQAFAKLKSAAGYFYQGNSYVHLFKFDEAIDAYQRALALQPGFVQAQANLTLSKALQKDYTDAQNKAPQVKADALKYDRKPGQGKDHAVTQGASPSDTQWLQNLDTSPARFLQRKFSLEDAQRSAAPAVQP